MNYSRPLLFCICTLAALWARPAHISAQALKAKPKLKPDAQQVIDAENALKAANCGLHREESKLQITGGKLVVVPSSNQVDHLAFPKTVTDAELAKLLPFAARLPSLRSIDLGSCTKVTEKGIGCLKLAPNARALFLDHTSANGQWLVELANLQSLEWLDLSATPLSDEAIARVRGIKSLSSLVVGRMPNLTEVGIKNIVETEQIRHLDISINGDRSKMAEAVSTAKFLVSLKVSPVSNADAAHLAKMTGIETLDISNSTVDDDGVKLLAGCASLRSLNLAFTPISGRGIDALAELKHLHELDVKGTAWNEKGLAAVSRIPSITLLDLRGTSITDSGLDDLCDLPALERLYLGHNSITDAGLTKLTQLRSLRSLNLNTTQVQVAGAKHLERFAVLEQLHLQSTAVTHEAIRELSKIKSLRYLDLKNNCPEIGDADEARFKKDLPNTFIATSFCGQKTAMVWPGAQYFAFRLPDLKYPVPPPNFTPPTKLPTPTEKMIAAPPPIRIPTTGSTSSKP